MDWTTFFKDNSQAFFTLGGVLLGSAITFLGNLLNNKFQARENDKERLEKRKEAKAQLAIEIMKNDIKHIENVNNLVFEFLNKVKMLNLRRDRGELTQSNWWSELLKMMDDEKGAVAKLIETDTVTDILAYTNGEEVYTSYNNFKDLFTEYLRALNNPSITDTEREAVFENLIIGGGKFQRTLRDKMISIRDFK